MWTLWGEQRPWTKRVLEKVGKGCTQYGVILGWAKAFPFPSLGAVEENGSRDEYWGVQRTREGVLPPHSLCLRNMQ